MVFSSILFIFYFLPVFLLCYHLSPQKFKNYVLLIFSIAFYSWGAPKFIFVILGTTVLDFYLVNWMDRSQKPSERKWLLSISILVNIGLLFYFKYSNFFIENVNVGLKAIGVSEISWVKLILPIGISFYTFETITYVMDVYRKVHKPVAVFRDYLLYILFFPKLIAGPIIRFHELADQINGRFQTEKADDRLTGFYQFAIGLAKKVLIANHIGIYADQYFGMNYAEMGPAAAWLGILAYTFQIYFDFSGYSDMAIGLARMVGFKISENFNNPYTSKSITEFWRRWHISLGNWMRNYLYIPLGGNRVGSKRRLYLNLWIVFLASGLWHGASWNFIIWGAFHGLFLVLERVFLLRLYERIGAFFSTLITFLVVMIGWVFFRIETFPDAIEYIQQLFSFTSFETVALSSEMLCYYGICILFAFMASFQVGTKFQNLFYREVYTLKEHGLMLFLVFFLMVLSVSTITAFSFNPFIYFRF
jgi:alginate O-acetyltransferase complex protein AlgI